MTAGVDADRVRQSLALLNEIDQILSGARNTRKGSRVWFIRRLLQEPRREIEDYLGPSRGAPRG